MTPVCGRRPVHCPESRRTGTGWPTPRAAGAVAERSAGIPEDRDKKRGPRPSDRPRSRGRMCETCDPERSGPGRRAAGRVTGVLLGGRWANGSDRARGIGDAPAGGHPPSPAPDPRLGVSPDRRDDVFALTQAEFFDGPPGRPLQAATGRAGGVAMTGRKSLIRGSPATTRGWSPVAWSYPGHPPSLVLTAWPARPWPGPRDSESRGCVAVAGQRTGWTRPVPLLDRAAVPGLRGHAGA